MARGVEPAASCWVLRVKGFRRGRPPSWQEWRHRRSVEHESSKLRGLVVVHRLKLGQDAVASTRFARRPARSLGRILAVSKAWVICVAASAAGACSVAASLHRDGFREIARLVHVLT